MMINRPKVSINAAFLKEIKDDNLQLYSLLENLKTYCMVDDPLNLDPERFCLLTADLRDQLAMHFTLEETFGYLDLAVEVNEVISSESDRLKKQHNNLYLEIAAIAEEVHDAVFPDLNENQYADQVNRFKAFSHAFQNHEAAEFDLIMSASYENLLRKQNSEISDLEVLSLT